jgi:hypothetical protein
MDRLATLTGVALFLASWVSPARSQETPGPRPKTAAMHNTWLCMTVTAASSRS